MELIQETTSRITRSGKKEKRGLFHCPYCEKNVERGLRDGKKNHSCGCARTSVRAKYKHIDQNLFWVYHGIKARCCNPKHSTYYRYGERGIQVCQLWLDDPNHFFEWALSNGWRKGLEVDRIDNDGNYDPTNCRIVPHSENSRNRSSSKLTHEIVVEMRERYAVGDITKADLGKQFGVTDATAGKVINHKIWSDKEVSAC